MELIFREHGIIQRFLGREHSGLLWEADVLMVFFWRRLRYFILTLVLLAALQGAALAAPQLSGVRFHSEAARDRVVLDLSEASDYELDKAADGKRVTVVLKGVRAGRSLKQPMVTGKRVKGVRWSASDSEVRVVVSLATACKASVGQLKNPPRLFLDLTDPIAAGTARKPAAGKAAGEAAAAEKTAAAAKAAAAAKVAAAALGLPEGTEAVQLAAGLMRFDYHVWQDDGWITAYFLDVDPAVYRLKVALGGGKIPGLATTSAISDSVNAVAAINASFFNWNGDLLGVTKTDGTLVGTMYVPRSAMGILPNGQAYFGTVTYNGSVTIGGVTQYVGGVDAERGTDSLVIYNRYYGPRTRTNEYGRELTVVNGCVTAIAAGNSVIPADGCVISLHGAAADIYSQVQVGDAVAIHETLGAPWDRATEVVSVGPCLVKDGAVRVTTAAEQLGEIDRHREPRSAIATTTRGTYLLAVVDGRQPSSHGCTLTEWAQLLKAFGAKDALNLDGGGSSELVAGGQVLNSPSDGRERGVGSAIVVLRK